MSRLKKTTSLILDSRKMPSYTESLKKTLGMMRLTLKHRSCHRRQGITDALRRCTQLTSFQQEAKNGFAQIAYLHLYAKFYYIVLENCFFSTSDTFGLRLPI